MWIHELSKWPVFSWDAEALTSQLASVRNQQGRLIGQMESLGFELQQEAALDSLTSEVLKTSAIEGETLSRIEVRSSVARRLGIEVEGPVAVSRDVEGIVEVMLDASQNFLAPLSEERICAWHAALFPTGRSGLHKISVGQWRPSSAGPMQVVSGPIGREKVHFQAPDADRLPEQMQAFIQWVNETDTLDPVMKAGIAHFWFITLHPFEDGNGRIARAIGDMMLARSDGLAERFYSLSTQIEADKDQYYFILESQQRGSLDLTPWLSWFLRCLERAIQQSDELLGHVLLKAKVWQKIQAMNANERQRKAITKMLVPSYDGHMNTSKYGRMTKCSRDTALRDIQALVKAGILEKNASGGRSTSYRIVT